MLRWSAIRERQPSDRNSCVKISMNDGKMRSPLDGTDMTTMIEQWRHIRHQLLAEAEVTTSSVASSQQTPQQL